MYLYCVVCQDLQPEEKSNKFFFNFVPYLFMLLNFPLLSYFILYALPVNKYLLSTHYMPNTEFNCTDVDGYIRRQKKKHSKEEAEAV